MVVDNYDKYSKYVCCLVVGFGLGEVVFWGWTFVLLMGKTNNMDTNEPLHGAEDELGYILHRRPVASPAPRRYKRLPIPYE